MKTVLASASRPASFRALLRCAGFCRDLFCCALLCGFAALAGCSSSIVVGPAYSANPHAEGAAAPAQQAPAQQQAQAGTQPAPGTNPAHARPLSGSAPGQFDFYLLTMSWSPQYCAGDPGSPECAAHPGFVAHGLWPQDADGKYPQYCSSAPGPADPGAYTDILPTASLVEHEWQRHGTCSGLGADAYFQAIRAAFHSVQLPAEFTSASQPASQSPAAILAAFSRANPAFPAASFALSCGNNRLTAVEVCLDKGLRAEACQGVHTCGATSVAITSR